jgi:PilZ domain-containing protein
MRRLIERQYAMVSKTTKQGSVDLDVVVLAVDRGEAVLQPAGDPGELLGSEPMVVDCFLSFTHRDRPVALRGYLRQGESSTIRFGVGDGVVLRQRRAYPRLETALPVQLHMPDGSQPVAATTRDISAGGLAVDCPIEPEGERLQVTVELPTGLRIDAPCRLASRRGSMLALEWDGLDEETVTALTAFVIEAKRGPAGTDEDEQLAA